MKKILLGLSLISLAVSALATPQDRTESFYVPLSLGWYAPDGSRNVDNGLFGGLGVGYNFNNYFALQSTFDYFSPRDRATGNNLTAFLWQVGPRLNWANTTNFVPYVTAGIGDMKLQSNDFAVAGGVGIDYYFAPRVSIGPKYQIAYYQGHTDSFYSLALTFSFGGPKPVVNPTPAPAPVKTTIIIQQPKATPTPQQTMLAKAQTSLKDLLPNGVPMCQGNTVGNQPGCVTFDGNTMIMHLNIKFLQNKSKLQSQYATPVSSFGNFMTAYPNTKAILYGYASSEGPAAFNQTLSLKRAKEVRNYLINHYDIDPTRLQAVGMGTQNPIADNSTLAGRQANRRVEATVPVPTQLVN